MTQVDQKIKKPNSFRKPGQEGGRLIRAVIQFLKRQKVTLPLNSHILIAVSGGSDSVGLAHLLVHHGRRILDRTQVHLLHVNHCWRAEASDQDERFVKDLGNQWGVPVIVKRLDPPLKESPESWEELARNARKKIFLEESKKWRAQVLTAHQADDLAETVLWRLFTGAAQTHGGGIAFQHQAELRPFLGIRKQEILKYLREEGQGYQEDLTNFSERFMRARMRKRLMPELEKLFPNAIQHLVSLALKAQEEASFPSEQDNEELPQIALLSAAGIRARRPHLEQILKKAGYAGSWNGELQLPGGWVLNGKKKDAAARNSNLKGLNKTPLETWILQRF